MNDNPIVLAVVTILAIIAIIAIRSPHKIKTKGVLAGIVSVLVFVAIVIAVTAEGGERRGYMQAWIDYPFDGRSMECRVEVAEEKKGDQTSSDLALGYYPLNWGYHYLGGDQFHKSCAGNDDAKGKSVDATRLVYNYRRAKWYVTLAYGTNGQGYGTAAYTLYNVGQYNLDVSVTQGAELKGGIGLTWRF